MEDKNIFEITWLPLWKCNFKCPYCKTWKNTNALEFQSLDILIEAWDNLFHKLRRKFETKIDLIVSGGEPTIYPNIFELLKYLTNRFDSIHICTNLSFNAHNFLRLNISKEKIFIHATFHPAFISMDSFIGNLILLKEYIKETPVTFVADENNLKNQKNFIKKINDCGIRVTPLCLKFFGEQPKKETVGLNVLNTEDELKLIKEIKNDQKTPYSDYESSQLSSLGKKCLAGYRYIQVFPNGNIKKCSTDSTHLGNIFDDDLNLFNEPQICKQKICPYQYRNIIE